jgi:hypothetical protein
VQISFSNSRVDLLILVKCIENIEKLEKCKPNFVGLLVKNPTTFVKHDHSFD